METVNERIDALGKQFSLLQVKMEKQKEYSEKRVSEVIEDVMREIENLCRENANDENKTSVFVALFKAQKSFMEKRKKIKAAFLEKTYKSERKRAMMEAEEAADCAAFAINFALLEINQAILEFYEAIDKLEKYGEKYGEYLLN